MAETDKEADLVAEQNATLRATITVYQPDSNTEVQDITGTVAAMQVRSSYSSTSPAIVTLTSNTGQGLTLGGPAGTIDIVMTAAQTALFKVRNQAGAVPPTQDYYYDILLQYPSADDSRTVYGKITVYAAITALSALAGLVPPTYTPPATSDDDEDDVLTSTAATISTVTAATSSEQILAANPLRKGFSIFNDSSAFMYLAAGGAASQTAYTTQIPPQTLFESSVNYQGVYTAVWASAIGAARITEYV